MPLVAGPSNSMTTLLKPSADHLIEDVKWHAAWQKCEKRCESQQINKCLDYDYYLLGNYQTKNVLAGITLPEK